LDNRLFEKKNEWLNSLAEKSSFAYWQPALSRARPLPLGGSGFSREPAGTGNREKRLQIKAMDATGADGYHACALHS
jgi:hypothetical protein